MPDFVRSLGECKWLVAVWVQPGAKQEGIAGIYQSCLKVRLKAPAVDNKANKALVGFVAASLNLKKGQVTLVSGRASRKKDLLVESDKEPLWVHIVPKV